MPLTDSTGSAQLTLDKEKWSDLISSVRAETVVRVSGTVQARPEKDQRGVCVCVCVHVCMCNVHNYICTCACKFHAGTYVCMTYVCTCIRMCGSHR